MTAFATGTERCNRSQRIRLPDGFDSAVEFTHRIQTKTLTAGEAILPGLLLPYQCIFVRW